MAAAGRPSYDQALKRLLGQAHDGFLALVAPDLRWRQERSPELPAGPRQADFVWEVARPDGSVGLLHLELQTRVDPNLGERLAEYALRLWRRDHLPVRSVIVLLRETRQAPGTPFRLGWGTRWCCSTTSMSYACGKCPRNWSWSGRSRHCGRWRR